MRYRGKRWKWLWLATVTLAVGLLAVSGLLAGCGDNGNGTTPQSRQTSPAGAETAQPTTETAADTSDTANVEPSTDAEATDDTSVQALPTARVTGSEATIDLGEIRPKSSHRMVFEIVNAGEADLAIETIQRHCECISAVDPPERLPAGQATRVKVLYEAPDIALPYTTRLTVVTNSKARRFISLWVKSRSVRVDEE